MYRFNPPAGWPTPTDGWVPPPGWKPDPTWPPAPEGWRFWIETDDVGATTPTADPWTYPGDTTAAPSKGPSHLLWLALGTAAIVVLGGIAVVATVMVQRGEKLTEAEAQRNCRSAFEAEFTRRTEGYDNFGGSQILTSLTGVDLTDTWAEREGISVNGVVKYDMTTALVPTVHSTIPLTCRATREGGVVRTTVSNRS